jgi:hypothetical protein
MNKVMEYRAWIRVPGLDVEGDDAGRLLAALDSGRYGDVGPVLSGAGDSSDVVVSTDTDDPAAAARQLYDVIVEAIDDAGLGYPRPSRVEVEPADHRELAPA